MPTFPRTDFHIHATHYRTQRQREDMTVAGIVRRCEELAFTAVGVVEHLNDSPTHPVECLGQIVEEARCVSSDLALWVGAELDILDETGAVSGPPNLKEELGLDYLLAAVHGALREVTSFDELLEANHRLLMGVVKHSGSVDVIAHPWAGLRSLGLRDGSGEWSFSQIPQNCQEELLHALSDHGKALELNSRAKRDFGDPAFIEFMDKVREMGVKVAIGSDSHGMDRVGASLELDRFLQDTEFPPDQIWLPQART